MRFESPRPKFVNLALTTEERSMLEAVAVREGKSLSSVLRDLVRREFKSKRQTLKRPRART